jgi:anti-sigma factor RsiW
MSAEPTLNELNAFVDGQLELSRHLEIEARLRDSGALRAQIEVLQRLRESVRSEADYHAAPPALRAALAVSLAAAAAASADHATPPAPTPPRAAAPARAVRDVVQRWLAWRPLASALAFMMVAAVGVNLVMSQRWQDDRLRDEVVASHSRATLTQRLVDVASSDHHTVKPFLSARLDFSPPVRELTVPGSVFVGGRVDYLEGRPVAALVYRQGNHIVDSYVWPTQEADSAVRMSSQRGFHLARWSREGMAHCVISDVSADVFAAIAKELELAPASTSSD